MSKKRFVVRELTGFTINQRTPRNGTVSSHVLPGLTVWVADEAYNGREIRVWRTEEINTRGLTAAGRRDWMRVEARALAESLNAQDA